MSLLTLANTRHRLSGDAIERINASALDKVVVTNSVPQEEHEKLCPKLEVLDVGHVFAEVTYLLRISLVRAKERPGNQESAPWGKYQRALPI